LSRKQPYFLRVAASARSLGLLTVVLEVVPGLRVLVKVAIEEVVASARRGADERRGTVEDWRGEDGSVGRVAVAAVELCRALPDPVGRLSSCSERRAADLLLLPRPSLTGEARSLSWPHRSRLS